MALAGIVEQRQSFGQPLLLAPNRLGVIAAPDADAQGVGQAHALAEEVGRAVIDLGVLLVPQNVAALGIEEDDPLGQHVERLAQPHLGPAGLVLGGGDGAARLQPDAQPAAQTIQALDQVAPNGIHGH